MLRPNRVVRRQHSSYRFSSAAPRAVHIGFTLIEMLIAMAITLLMIGAVVTLFANISNSVRNRRAVIELSGQMRHARNMLQQDLQGATCNGLVWQRPDENQGYIEIIEGPRREGQASDLIDGDNTNGEIDHTASILPSSNLPFTTVSGQERWATDGGSLGDGDDILMLTVRNEHEPFVGRAPKTDGSANAVRRVGINSPNAFADWEPATIQSPLAEVVWYSVENPDADNNPGSYFGEPGLRTIYRRALLIAPWLNPYRTVASDGTISDTFSYDGGNFVARPGLLRILPNNLDNTDANDRQRALAALIAYQEKYDISARLEWDPLLGADGRWKIVANTLGDLTKRENRYEHHFFRNNGDREFPFAVVSMGSGYGGNAVNLVTDPEIGTPAGFAAANVRATLVNDSASGINGLVAGYTVTDEGNAYPVRPLAVVGSNSDTVATARVMLNDEGQVVQAVRGLVPLSGSRRGEDVMLSDALAFDLRVYDPGAPIFAHRDTETILEPSDPGWLAAYTHGDNTSGSASLIGRNNASNNGVFPYIGQGAYVDLGYGYNALARYLTPAWAASLPKPKFANAFINATMPWFFDAKAVGDIYGNQLAPGYAVFDTWSFHYENDGLNQDHDRDANGNELVDEGTNGLDDPDPRLGGTNDRVDNANDIAVLGPDDAGERETAPPYDKPLRGLQAVLRLYERDSRQVRQVSVNQSFVPE